MVNFISVGPVVLHPRILNMQTCSYHCNKASSINSGQRLQQRYHCWGGFVSKTPRLPSTQLQGEFQGVWLLEYAHAQLSHVYYLRHHSCDNLYQAFLSLFCFWYGVERKAWRRGYIEGMFPDRLSNYGGVAGFSTLFLRILRTCVNTYIHTRCQHCVLALWAETKNVCLPSIQAREYGKLQIKGK